MTHFIKRSKISYSICSWFVLMNIYIEKIANFVSVQNSFSCIKLFSLYRVFEILYMKKLTRKLVEKEMNASICRRFQICCFNNYDIMIYFRKSQFLPSFYTFLHQNSKSRWFIIFMCFLMNRLWNVSQYDFSNICIASSNF